MLLFFFAIGRWQFEFWPELSLAKVVIFDIWRKSFQKAIFLQSKVRFCLYKLVYSNTQWEYLCFLVLIWINIERNMPYFMWIFWRQDSNHLLELHKDHRWASTTKAKIKGCSHIYHISRVLFHICISQLPTPSSGHP